MKPKKETVEQRFLSRLFELHAITLFKNQLPRYVRQIKEGDALLLYDQSERLKIYELQMGKQLVPVVYDRFRSALVTALPPSWAKEQHPVFRARGY